MPGLMESGPPNGRLAQIIGLAAITIGEIASEGDGRRRSGARRQRKNVAFLAGIAEISHRFGPTTPPAPLVHRLARVHPRARQHAGTDSEQATGRAGAARRKPAAWKTKAV